MFHSKIARMILSWLNLWFDNFDLEMKVHQIYRNYISRRYLSRGYKYPLVSLVVPTCRPSNIDKIVLNVARQTYTNLELIVVTQGYDAEDIEILKNELSKLYNLQNVLVLYNDCRNVGSSMNQAVACASGVYIAKMDDDDDYFANYIFDMILPFSYLGCDLVGKKEVFMYLEQLDKVYKKFDTCSNQITDFVYGPTFVFKKNICNKILFDDTLSHGSDTKFLRDILDNGFKIYSADPYNFLFHRKRSGHTWKIDQHDLIKDAVLVSDGLCYQKIIT